MIIGGHMDIKKVGKRGLLFTFFELKNSDYDCVTNVYVINGNNQFFICDTYLGPFYMKKIKTYLETHFGKKKYVVFNSHSHWDHIWGNSEFRDDMIIAHVTCRESIIKDGVEDLKHHIRAFAKDDIEIIVPNVTFDGKLILDEEGIEFFYSPGHSADSASCYDHIDQVLFVGDNVDEPIPSFMCWHDLERYRDTLNQYIEIDASIIVQSHGDVTTNAIVKQNITYLERLISHDEITFTHEVALKKHLANIAFLRDEEK